MLLTPGRTDERIRHYVCQASRLHATANEVARATGVPRSTIHSRLLRLRRHFERANLRDYL